MYLFYCFYHICKDKNIVYARYYLALFPLFLYKKKFIVEFHGGIDSRIERYYVKKLVALSNCSGVVLITNSLKNDFINYGIITEKIHCKVLADACDIPDVDLNDKVLNSVGYVGHLYAGRGVELILNLAKSFPDINFHIIGGRDNDLNQFKKISTTNVTFHGFVRHSDLHNYYSLFDIALAPYQDNVSNAGNGNTVKWMSPMKLFEYMAYKKAVICSDLPVLHEVGVDNVHLLFAKHDSLDIWKQKLELLLNDKHLKEEVSNNAYNLFLSSYTWSARCSEIISMLK